jgi:hypothetical protein
MLEGKRQAGYQSNEGTIDVRAKIHQAFDPAFDRARDADLPLFHPENRLWVREPRIPGVGDSAPFDDRRCPHGDDGSRREKAGSERRGQRVAPHDADSCITAGSSCRASRMTRGSDFRSSA